MSKTMKQNRSSFDLETKKDNLKIVREKVFKRTVRVINHFNLDDKLIPHLSDCLLDRNTLFDDKFSFKFDKIAKSKKLPSSSMTLKNTTNPFYFMLGGNRTVNECNFVINFDSKQNITNIVFSLTYHVNGSKFRGTVVLIYNSNFEFIGRELNENYYNPLTKKFTTVRLKKDSTMIISEDDELFLMGLYFNKNHELIIEALPEVAIESAYDFTSDDFKSRLELVNMLLV